MLTTPRCRIRMFEEKDLDSLMEYRNNSEWMKYQYFKNLSRAEYRRTLLAPLNIFRGIQLALVDKETDQLLGDLYLIKKEDILTIGYTIDPQYARQGYAVEALQAFLKALRKKYPECDITALTEIDNTASKNLLFKLGFVYDKLLEESQHEVYLYSL